MSTIKVNNLSGKGGATPNLPDGAVISGVATVTNLKPTNVNVSGAVTATTFDGSLKSTGTPTLGLGVTINTSGVHISGVTTVGVVTGGTFYGDGSNLTGVGDSVAPHYYNPDVNDQTVPVITGIGITFNKKILAGSGTATLKIVNAGVAGTTIQSWGVSSATYSVTQFTLGALVSNLEDNQTYQLDIPDGFIVDGSGSNYTGTAYTFASGVAKYTLYAWGTGSDGRLGLGGDQSGRSSPTQIPGTTWSMGTGVFGYSNKTVIASRTDGTLWSWGEGQHGETGLNDAGTPARRSSPTQIPGTTWAPFMQASANQYAGSVRTDGTLWMWGHNGPGRLGLNDNAQRSSPTQVGSDTTWAKERGSNGPKFATGAKTTFAIKTDGTLWSWGYCNWGELGQNNSVLNKSSPAQIPGTTWRSVSSGRYHSVATRTDGTLWTWGSNGDGYLGQNNEVRYSSPTQIPGTNWNKAYAGNLATAATKTDGTLWVMGKNNEGQMAQNNKDVSYSSPTQIPGTTWEEAHVGESEMFGIKTDGTLWAWGYNNDGTLGQNNAHPTGTVSSPIQVGSETDWDSVINYYAGALGVRQS